VLHYVYSFVEWVDSNTHRMIELEWIFPFLSNQCNKLSI
jgi:hypothetical protein